MLNWDQTRFKEGVIRAKFWTKQGIQTAWLDCSQNSALSCIVYTHEFRLLPFNSFKFPLISMAIFQLWIFLLNICNSRLHVVCTPSNSHALCLIETLMILPFWGNKSGLAWALHRYLQHLRVHRLKSFSVCQRLPEPTIIPFLSSSNLKTFWRFTVTNRLCCSCLQMERTTLAAFWSC